jgi:uncharacterized membrane-anchored protein
MMASIFGTNTGDFVADYLHLGHLAGLPVLALVFALILFAEHRAQRRSTLFFWAAIITMRTAATNVGDAFHDFKIGYEISIPAVLALFALSVLLYGDRARLHRGTAGTVNVNATYWVCMMLAGTLGTLGGDFLAFRMGFTAPGAFAAVTLLAIGTMRAFAAEGNLLAPVPYWITVGLIRIAGTSGGDSAAHALGLPAATALTGLVFIVLIVYFYAIRGPREAVQAS